MKPSLWLNIALVIVSIGLIILGPQMQGDERMMLTILGWLMLIIAAIALLVQLVHLFGPRITHWLRGELQSRTRPNIAQLQATGDIPGLVKALNFAEQAIRQKASTALADMGAPAVEPLIIALRHGHSISGAGAAAAATALGQIGNPRAIEPLIDSLGSTNNELWGASIQALRQLGQPAYEALAQRLDQADGDWKKTHYVNALAQMGTPAVGVLVDTLQHQRSSARQYAADALGIIGADARTAVPSLVQILENDTDSLVRWSAAKSLGRIGDRTPEALAALKGALGDEQESIREAAKRALEDLGQTVLDASEEALLKTVPPAWVQNDAHHSRLVSIIRAPNPQGSGCYYYKEGLCMFRIWSRGDSSASPEDCSLQQGRFTSCHVWAMDPQ